MPSQPNLVQVNWNGQQLQLTPGIARQLAAAQNTGASALQAQDEDIDMPTPPDSPTLRPINLGQQAPQIIVNQGPANAPNPLPVHQNLAQPVQQENVGQAQNCFKLDTYGYNIQDILAEYEFLEPYEQLYDYLQVV
ncbi:hypothetical protein B0H14DRAFT_2557155 [Mycena olivaceomarginata]|nr:hypothetical protein B0H14DRAFT_2557155 [Mycena olivaceomarginata]